MSKISITDLHHANDLNVVESVDFHGGDVLKAAKERAIAARNVAGGIAAIKSPGLPIRIIEPICPVEPLCPPVIAGFKPICPPKPVLPCKPIPITVGLIALPLESM